MLYVRAFLMHRVELKFRKGMSKGELLKVPNAPCGVEIRNLQNHRSKAVPFLMHRVELKSI